MGDASQSTSSWGAELFGRVMVAEDIAINGSLGYGSLEGAELDANGGTITFVSNLLHIYVSPAYRLTSSPSFTFWVKAGAGLGFLDSQNDAIAGAKLLFHGGVEADYALSPGLYLNADVGITTSTGDLDGIRASAKPDNFLTISIGIAKALE